MIKLCPRLLKALGCFALLAAVSAAPAEAAQTTTARARAVVVQPMTLVNDRPLAFGFFSAGASPGTVTIDADTGARSITGGVTGMGGDISAASFTGYTSGGRQVRVSTPQSTVILMRVGGTETMAITGFNIDGDSDRKFPVDQVFTFQVGGTLAVNAAQPEGAYEGSFIVTAEYQ